MKSITSESMLNLLYNKKLPQVYRDEDSRVDYALKRYLSSLIEGGLSSSANDISNLMSLVDPMSIPNEYFPYFCSSFGLTYFPDIDISYQRKFLANIGELNKRRGTFACVRFLIRALTGLNSELSCDGSYLQITLLAQDYEQLQSIETSMGVIRNYLSSQIPHFIEPTMSFRIDTQVINSKSYTHSFVSYNRSYTISKYEEGN